MLVVIKREEFVPAKEKRKKKAKEEVLFPTPVTFGNENKDLFEELRILRKSWRTSKLYLPILFYPTRLCT